MHPLQASLVNRPPPPGMRVLPVALLRERLPLPAAPVKLAAPGAVGLLVAGRVALCLRGGAGLDRIPQQAVALLVNLPPDLSWLVWVARQLCGDENRLPKLFHASRSVQFPFDQLRPRPRLCAVDLAGLVLGLDQVVLTLVCRRQFDALGGAQVHRKLLAGTAAAMPPGPRPV